ncbi:MAG: hypothetical protein IKP73_05970 [Bacteroidales bacterium]|nr:hypothetical protein [Bacteroidales bacterium]
MKTKIFTLIAMALLSMSCNKERSHEFWDSEYGNINVGYLAFQLVWDEHDDTISTIDNVKITASGADGFLKQYDFSSPGDAADQLQQLPEGTYDLLIAVDMADSNGYTLTQSDTKNAANSLPLSIAALRDPSSSPHQSWYATTTATVKNNEITIAKFALKRLLSMISIIIDGAPDGTTITATVSNVAQNVELTTPRPSAESTDGISLGTATAIDGILKIENRTLLPTADGSDRATITLTTTEQGNTLVSTIDAPKMELGRYYELKLDYEKLSPYIHLTGNDINDWQQDWTADGEILNPAD